MAGYPTLDCGILFEPGSNKGKHKLCACPAQPGWMAVVKDEGWTQPLTPVVEDQPVQEVGKAVGIWEGIKRFISDVESHVFLLNTS